MSKALPDLIYDNCEMPLYNFIKIACTNDLNWLVIEGTPTQLELENAWEAVFTEYSDLSPTPNTTYIVQVTREIRHLETKIAIIQAIIDRFKISYLPELVPILNEYGFYYDFTPETMLSDLQMVIAECSQFVVQKGVKEGELKRFFEGQRGDPAKENDYDEVLSELSKFQGYHLKSKELTVSEFCAIFNRFKRQNK